MTAGADEELRQIRARVDRLVREAAAETRRAVADTRELVRATRSSRTAGPAYESAVGGGSALAGPADREVSGAA